MRSALHIVELLPDPEALVRYMQQQNIPLATGEAPCDHGYGVHAWLKAAFGDAAPQPWRVLMDGRRPPRILGYADVDGGALRDRMRMYADPSVCAVCDDAGAILSRPMPVWTDGQELTWACLCCPIGRQSATGSERDVWTDDDSEGDTT